MSRQSVGIFGGTFDPVHYGHIQVAKQVRSLLFLDRVEFIPAYRPPHKLNSPMADAWHRFAMLALATTEEDGLFISTLELEKREPVYTIDTIERLRKIWKSSATLVFILGADAFEEILTWRDPLRLLKSCHFAVMARPGHTLRIEQFPPGVRERIVDLRSGHAPMHVSDCCQIYLCSGVTNPVSSTLIRRAVREGRTTDGLAPTVRHHIDKYKLYRDADEARNQKTGFTKAHRP